MRFFRQTIRGSCNIIAIQQAWAFLGKFPSYEEVEGSLTIHEGGSWIAEIGTYFEERGVNTQLIANREKIETTDPIFRAALDEYAQIGNFKNKIPTEADIGDKPVIINVDWYKISGKSGGPGAHYVVLVRGKAGKYDLYDGLNFTEKVEVTFEEVYHFSQEIFASGENGMWLILE